MRSRLHIKLGRKSMVTLWICVWIVTVLTVILLVPGILVNRSISLPVPASSDSSVMKITPTTKLIEEEKPIMISVYLSQEKKVETVPLEYYVRGVVAAEMPAQFELEALKAQAIAARTYIVRRLVNADQTGVPVDDAVVTDTVAHQVYSTVQKLRSEWGMFKYATNIDKLNRAVNETEGQILTYEGEPINATFFSTSNGYTENSEDYWTVYVPYLRSVPSPWDEQLSPKYKETVTMNYHDLLQKLGVRSITASTGKSGLKVLETTAGHRIKKAQIAGITLSGKELREKLGLNSSQLSLELGDDGNAQITTYGYGHGVGMSQWGANGMAKEGSSAKQIVQHYYTGVEIGDAEQLLKQKSTSGGANGNL